MANKLKYDLIDKLLLAVAIFCYGPVFVINIIDFPDFSNSWWLAISSLVGAAAMCIFAYRIIKKQKELTRKQPQPISLDDKEKKTYLITLKGTIIAMPLICIAIAVFTFIFPFNPTGDRDARILHTLEETIPIALICTTIFIIIFATVYFKIILPRQKKHLILSPLRVYFMVRVILFSMISAIPFMTTLVVLMAKAKMAVPPEWVYFYYMGIPVAIIAGGLCWPWKTDFEDEAQTLSQENQRID